MSLQTKPTNMPCNSAAQTAPLARQASHRCSFRTQRRDLTRLLLSACSPSHFQQAHEMALQRGKRRTLYVRFRVYDEIPSCGNLLAMQPHHFSDAPPDTIAHHRSAQCSLDAEAKAALRQAIRFQEHGELGTRAALPVAVNSVEVRLAHNTRASRILLPLFTRA